MKKLLLLAFLLIPAVAWAAFTWDGSSFTKLDGVTVSKWDEAAVTSCTPNTATISYSSTTPFTVGDSDRAITDSCTSGSPSLSTNDSSICTIVAGALHAVGAGSCIATNNCPSGGGYCSGTASQTITVSSAVDDEFEIAGATYYAVAPVGYSYSGTQTTNYGARKYNTLSAAVAALSATPSTPIVVNIIGTWSSADTTRVDESAVNGATSTNYVLIRTVNSTGSRHQGKYSTSYYRLETGTGYPSLNLGTWVTVQGVQISNSGTASTDIGVQRANYRNHVTLVGNIIKGGYYGIFSNAGSATDGDDLIYNNVVYGSYRTCISDGANASHATKILNNTVYGCNVGNIAYGYGISGSSFVNDIVENNISIGNSYNANQADYRLGTFSYNISQDSSSTGTGALTGKTNTDVKFTNVTGGSEDFSLQAGSVALNAGKDESGIFTTNIIGQTRSSWNIGAF